MANETCSECASLKKRIRFLEDTLKQFTTVVPPMDPLERSLIEVSNATEGQGLKIRLYNGPATSKGLRQATQQLMDLTRREAEVKFIGSFDPTNKASAELHAEAAYYRNLALLAHATSEALSTGR